MKSYYVYLLSNHSNTTLYIGVTSDLIRRIYEHKSHMIAGFTNKYNVTKLVYFERFEDPENAIYREKQLKAWNRTWKDDLIRKENPVYRDLYSEIV